MGMLVRWGEKLCVLDSCGCAFTQTDNPGTSASPVTRASPLILVALTASSSSSLMMSWMLILSVCAVMGRKISQSVGIVAKQPLLSTSIYYFKFFYKLNYVCFCIVVHTNGQWFVHLIEQKV